MRVWGVSARGPFYCCSCYVCVCGANLQYPKNLFRGFIIYSVAGVSKLNTHRKCNLIKSARRRIRAPDNARAEYFSGLILRADRFSFIMHDMRWPCRNSTLHALLNTTIPHISSKSTGAFRVRVDSQLSKF